MITYRSEDCVCFWRSGEPFGGYSNMAGGYAIQLGPYRARTSEHLYQAMRFPAHPAVQEAVLAQPSPLIAKRVAYRSLNCTRPDWDEVKLDVMRWCLELKLAQHDRFGTLLRQSGDRPIVEASPRDDFWGAKPSKDGYLHGWNHLGRLLMIMRDRLACGLVADPCAPAIEIANFKLAGADAMVLAIG